MPTYTTEQCRLAWATVEMYGCGQSGGWLARQMFPVISVMSALLQIFFFMYCVTPAILVNCPSCKILLIMLFSSYLHYLKLFIVFSS